MNREKAINAGSDSAGEVFAMLLGMGSLIFPLVLAVALFGE